MIRPLLAGLAALTLSGPVHACSEQLIRTVEQRMPQIGEPADPRDLSCAGITQLYFIVTERPRSRFGPAHARLRQRQEIAAVFRREGLID